MPVVHSRLVMTGRAADVVMQGTVLIRSAEELEGYSRSEEDRLEALVKGIADTGARVVVAGSAIGDMALHFIEKYGMMAVRIPSKFDLRRFCRCARAHSPPLPPDPTHVPVMFSCCSKFFFRAWRQVCPKPCERLT